MLAPLLVGAVQDTTIELDVIEPKVGADIWDGAVARVVTFKVVGIEYPAELLAVISK
jgi:hypothetical protein